MADQSSSRDEHTDATDEVENLSVGASDTFSITRHCEGCVAPIVNCECDCPPPRLYVADDVLLFAIRRGQRFHRYSASETITGTVTVTGMKGSMVEFEESGFSGGAHIAMFVGIAPTYRPAVVEDGQ